MLRLWQGLRLACPPKAVTNICLLQIPELPWSHTELAKILAGPFKVTVESLWIQRVMVRIPKCEEGGGSP